MSIAVALADKLDTLGGFWAIDEKPTGSKDPFALRRAALGVIRIVLENGLRLPLTGAAQRGRLGRAARRRIRPRGRGRRGRPVAGEARLPEGPGARRDRRRRLARRPAGAGSRRRAARRDHARASLAFFADRLKVYLRDKGARHDLIDAVFALPGQDDLLMIVWRVEALGRLLDTEDGKNLLAGYRRAANILRAEEKKDGDGAFAGRTIRRCSRCRPRALADALAAAGAAARERVGREDFEGAMRALADAARAGRRLLPRRHRQRRRSGAAPQPPAPARRTARRGARGRGFLQGRGSELTT